MSSAQTTSLCVVGNQVCLTPQIAQDWESLPEISNHVSTALGANYGRTPMGGGGGDFKDDKEWQAMLAAYKRHL
jgi:hypothetical protein